MRGKGLMIGIDIEETSKFATAGVKTLRFLPPLVITKAEVDTGLAILKEILS